MNKRRTFLQSAIALLCLPFAKKAEAMPVEKPQKASFTKGNTEVLLNGRVILSGVILRVYEQTGYPSLIGNKTTWKYRIELESIDS